jgi:hypothetical protein
VESDPIGLYGGTYSTYGFVGGNPVNSRDSRGLESGAALAAMNRAEGAVFPGSGSPCGCNARSPDFMNFQIDLYIFSASATYTRYGDIFVGKGFSRQYMNPLSRGVSISDSWLLKCNPTRDDINNFLVNWSGGAGGYYFLGGSYSVNASGSAISLGVGLGKFGSAVSGGAGFSPGMFNSYSGNLFGEPQ